MMNITEFKMENPTVTVNDWILTNKGEPDEQIGFFICHNNFMYFFDMNENFMRKKAM